MSCFRPSHAKGCFSDQCTGMAFGCVEEVSFFPRGGHRWCQEFPEASIVEQAVDRAVGVLPEDVVTEMSPERR